MSGARVRLLILLHDLAPFGAQRVALNIVGGLDRDVFRTAVCSFGPDEALAGEFRAAGAEVFQLGAGRYLSPAGWGKLFSLVREFRPHIIQTSLPEFSVPLRLLSPFLAGARIVHTIQNPFSSEPWYWSFLNRLTLPICGAAVFSSGGLMRHEQGNYPLRGELRLIANGIAPTPSAPGRPGSLREELGIKPGEKVIFCAARLTRQKGHDVLIRALAVMAGRGRNVRLLLAGDGEDLESLRTLALEAGVSGRTIFLGRRSDIGDLLGVADIYVSASRWESFDIALGEAMLAGVPCAGTDIPGHADILSDGVTGLSAPAGDAEALAAAAERLLDDPALASRLSSSARELASSRFTAAGMAAGYAALYLGLSPAAPRVMFFMHDLAPFGMQHSTLYIVRGLVRSGLSAAVCSFWGDETMAAEFRAAGAEVRLLRAGRFFSPRAWLGLLVCLRRLRPDIVETTLPELGVPLRLLSLFFPRLKLVHRFRNPLSSEPAFWRALNLATLRLCDAVAFYSGGIVGEVKEALPRLKGKLRVIQNGVELAPAPPDAGAGLRAELGLGAREKVVLCVGRLVRQKGQDVLLRALAALTRSGRSVRLLLAGDGEMEDELRGLAAVLEISREVVFLGRRTDIARVLDACDVYAAPSRWEGLSLSLGEAMLAGRPCVATDIPGHSDFLDGGRTAALVRPDDADGLAAAIARLLDDPAEADRLARAGRELVSRSFTTARAASGSRDLYLSLLSGPPGEGSAA